MATAVRTVDINPRLEGALLLALDELIADRPAAAMQVLIAAKTAVTLYARARAQGDLEALRRVVQAIEGDP